MYVTCDEIGIHLSQIVSTVRLTRLSSNNDNSFFLTENDWFEFDLYSAFGLISSLQSKQLIIRYLLSSVLKNKTFWILRFVSLHFQKMARSTLLGCCIFGVVPRGVYISYTHSNLWRFVEISVCVQYTEDVFVRAVETMSLVMIKTFTDVHDPHLRLARTALPEGIIEGRRGAGARTRCWLLELEQWCSSKLRMCSAYGKYGYSEFQNTIILWVRSYLALMSVFF